MKEPRQVLWWGLSINSLLLGVGLAALAGLGGPDFPKRAEHLLAGLYFAITSIVSLQARFQMVRAELAAKERHRRRADLALLLSGAPFLAVGLWGAPTDLRAHAQPPTVIAGQLESLYFHGERGEHGVRIRLEGREASLRWRCGWFTCGPLDEIKTIPRGATVQVEALGETVVGLRVGRDRLLEPEVEQRRLMMRDGVFFGVVILLTIAAVVYAWRWTFGWRRRDRGAEQLALTAFRKRTWPGLDQRKP